MKSLSVFLFLSLFALSGISLQAQCFDIANKQESAEEGTTVNFKKKIEENFYTSDAPKDHVYGQTFKAHEIAGCALSSISVKIERHSSQPRGGKLYIDLYKRDKVSRVGDDGHINYPLLKYISSSNAVDNPNGLVSASFSSPVSLEPEAEYAFIVRPEGFDTYALAASRDVYSGGEPVNYWFSTSMENGGITAPPNDVGSPEFLGHNQDLYFVCSFTKAAASNGRKLGGDDAAAFDQNKYYRLTCQWQGEGKSLDIVNDGKNNNQLQLANTGKFTGQAWKITPLGKGFYRLTTMWQGEDKSLDVVNDGKNNNKLQLAKTGRYSGQAWKITPVGNGYYRLTTKWQGDGKSLDVVNDGKNNNQLQLAKTGKYSGQLWKITEIKN